MSYKKPLHFKILNVLMVFAFLVTSTPCFSNEISYETRCLSPKSQNLLEIIRSGQEDETLAKNLLKYYRHHDLAFEVLAGIKTSKLTVNEKLNLQKQIQESVEILKSEFASLQFFSASSASEADREVWNLIELLNMLKDRLHVSGQGSEPGYSREELIQGRREAIFRNVLEKYNPYTLKESHEAFMQGNQTSVFKAIRETLKSMGIIAKNSDIAEAMNRDDLLASGYGLVQKLLLSLGTEKLHAAQNALKTGNNEDSALKEVREILTLQFHAFEDRHLQAALTEAFFAAEKKIRVSILSEFSPLVVYNALGIYLRNEQAGNTLWQNIKGVVSEKEIEDAGLASALRDVWNIQKKNALSRLSEIKPSLLERAIAEAGRSEIQGRYIKEIQKILAGKGMPFPLQEIVPLLLSKELKTADSGSFFNLKNLSLAGLTAALIGLSLQSELLSRILHDLTRINTPVLQMIATGTVAAAATGILLYKKVTRTQALKTGDLEKAFHSLSFPERLAATFLPLFGLGLFVFLVIIPVFSPVHAATGATLAMGTTLIAGAAGLAGDHLENGTLGAMDASGDAQPLLQVAAADVNPSRDAASVREKIREGFESGFSTSSSETERFQSEMIDVYDQQRSKKATLEEMSQKLGQVGEEASRFNQNHPAQQADLSVLENQKKEFLRSYELNQIYARMQEIHAKANQLVAKSNANKGKTLGDYQNLLNALEALKAEETGLLPGVERLSKRGDSPPTFTWEKVLNSTRSAMEDHQRNMNVTDEFNKAFDIDTYAKSPVHTVDFPALEKYWKGRLAEIPGFEKQADAVQEAFNALRLSLANRMAVDLEKAFRAKNISDVNSLLQYYHLHQNAFASLLLPQNKTLIEGIEKQAWILPVLEKSQKERSVAQIDSAFSRCLTQQGSPDFRGASNLIEELGELKATLDKFIQENPRTLLNREISALYNAADQRLNKLRQSLSAKEKQVAAQFKKDFSGQKKLSPADYRTQTSNRLLELERKGYRSELLFDLETFANQNEPAAVVKEASTSKPAVSPSASDTAIDEITRMLASFDPRAVLDSLHKGMKSKAATPKAAKSEVKETPADTYRPLQQELAGLKDSLSSLQKSAQFAFSSLSSADSLSKDELGSRRLLLIRDQELAAAVQKNLDRLYKKTDSLRVKVKNKVSGKSDSREASELQSALELFSGELAGQMKNLESSGKEIASALTGVDARISSLEKAEAENIRQTAQARAAFSSVSSQMDTLLIWEKELQTRISGFEKDKKAALEASDLSLAPGMIQMVTEDAISLLRQADSLARLSGELQGRVSGISSRLPSETSSLLQQMKAFSGRLEAVSKSLVSGKKELAVQERTLQTKIEKEKTLALKQQKARQTSEAALTALDEHGKISLKILAGLEKDEKALQTVFSDLTQKSKREDLSSQIAARDGLLKLFSDFENLLHQKDSFEAGLSLIRDSAALHESLLPEKAGLLLSKIREQELLSNTFFNELGQTLNRVKTLTDTLSSNISHIQELEKQTALEKAKARMDLEKITALKDSLLGEWQAFKNRNQTQLKSEDRLSSGAVAQNTLEEIASFERKIQENLPEINFFSTQAKAIEDSLNGLIRQSLDLKPVLGEEILTLDLSLTSLLKEIHDTQMNLAERQQKMEGLLKTAQDAKNRLLQEAKDKAEASDRLAKAELKNQEEAVTSLNLFLKQSQAAEDKAFQYFHSTAQGIEANTPNATEALLDLYGKHLQEIDSLLADSLQIFSRGDKIRDALLAYEKNYPEITSVLTKSLFSVETEAKAWALKLKEKRTQVSREGASLQARHTQDLQKQAREAELNRNAEEKLEALGNTLQASALLQNRQISEMGLLKQNRDSALILAAQEDSASLALAGKMMARISTEADTLQSGLVSFQKDLLRKKNEADTLKDRAPESGRKVIAKMEVLEGAALRMSEDLQKIKSEASKTLQSVAEKQSRLAEQASLREAQARRDSIRADSLAQSLEASKAVLDTLASQTQSLEDTLASLDSTLSPRDTLAVLAKAEDSLTFTLDTLSGVGKVLDSVKISAASIPDTLPLLTEEIKTQTQSLDTLAASLDSTGIKMEEARALAEEKIQDEMALDRQKQTEMARLEAQDTLFRELKVSADTLNRTVEDMLDTLESVENLSLTPLSQDTLLTLKSDLGKGVDTLQPEFEETLSGMDTLRDTVTLLSDSALIREEATVLLNRIDEAATELKKMADTLADKKDLVLKKVEDTLALKDSSADVSVPVKEAPVSGPVKSETKRASVAVNPEADNLPQEKASVQEKSLPSLDMKLNALTRWMQSFFAPDATRVDLWKGELRKILEGKTAWNTGNTDVILNLLNASQITTRTLVDTARSLEALNRRFTLGLTPEQKLLITDSTLKMQFEQRWLQVNQENLHTLLTSLGQSVETMYRDLSRSELDWNKNQDTLKQGFSDLLAPLQEANASLSSASTVESAVDELIKIHVTPAQPDGTAVKLSPDAGEKNLLEMIFNYLKDFILNKNAFTKIDEAFKGTKEISVAA